MQIHSQAHSQHVVLAVDDEPKIQQSLRHLLERDGYKVFTASDGEEALALMSDTKPCLVLTDIMMPRMDGLTLCRKIKQNQASAHIPVLFITAMVSDSDLDQGIAAGASDYIKKPFDRAEISMRVRNQIELHESLVRLTATQKQLSIISEAAKDGIVVIDNNGRVSHWNNAAQSIFGHSREEALDRDIHDLLALDKYHQAYSVAVPHFLKTGEGGAIGKSVELEARRKDGEIIPIELSLSGALMDGKWCAVGILRDIAERKQAQAAMEESERRYRTLFEAAAEGIVVIDQETKRMRFVNRAWRKMMGYEDDDVTALTVADMHPPEDMMHFESELEALIQGKKLLASRLRCLRKDGTLVRVDAKLTPMRLDERNCLVGFLTDLSERGDLEKKIEDQEKERKQMEIELRHAQKLEAVGQLAAGIAHEINTPAQFVGDSVVFIKETFEDVQKLIVRYREVFDSLKEIPNYEQLRQQIREAEEDADLDYLNEHVPGAFERTRDGLHRITDIVNAMKEFAHPDSRDQTTANLNKAIENTLTISRNEYKYVAEAVTELGDLPPLMCHIGDLSQVFLNLIVNAGHAIGDVVGQSGDKGQITVRTALDGHNVRIEFQDTGAGIPENIRSRIFDPFFTTKEVGKGSGQGLAIARSVIVDKHRGTLEVDTQEGKGTTFIITLPIDGKRDSNAGEAP